MLLYSMTLFWKRGRNVLDVIRIAKFDLNFLC